MNKRFFNYITYYKFYLDQYISNINVSSSIYLIIQYFENQTQFFERSLSIHLKNRAVFEKIMKTRFLNYLTYYKPYLDHYVIDIDVSSSIYLILQLF